MERKRLPGAPESRLTPPTLPLRTLFENPALLISGRTRWRRWEIQPENRRQSFRLMNDNIAGLLDRGYRSSPFGPHRPRFAPPPGRAPGVGVRRERRGVRAKFGHWVRSTRPQNGGHTGLNVGRLRSSCSCEQQITPCGGLVRLLGNHHTRAEAHDAETSRRGLLLGGRRGCCDVRSSQSGSAVLCGPWTFWRQAQSSSFDLHAQSVFRVGFSLPTRLGLGTC
jgi:hypothetical protein